MRGCHFRHAPALYTRAKEQNRRSFECAAVLRFSVTWLTLSRRFRLSNGLYRSHRRIGQSSGLSSTSLVIAPGGSISGWVKETLRWPKLPIGELRARLRVRALSWLQG